MYCTVVLIGFDKEGQNKGDTEVTKSNSNKVKNSYFCSPVNSKDTVSVNESFSNVCAMLHSA